MLFRPSTLFIELPESHRDGYRWFALDTDRRFAGAANFPRSKPYLTYNHDMNLGVGLLDPKMGDTWTVEWSEGGVSFANDTLKVELSR